MKPKFPCRSNRATGPDEKNANKGTKRGRELLEESLEKYGAGRSVVVDRQNRVIAGNKTVEAARAAGMKSIAVIETDGSSLVAVQRGDLDLKRDKKARELAIADNRVSEIDLEWNPEVLASLDVDLAQFWNENELKRSAQGLSQHRTLGAGAEDRSSCRTTEEVEDRARPDLGNRAAPAHVR